MGSADSSRTYHALAAEPVTSVTSRCREYNFARGGGAPPHRDVTTPSAVNGIRLTHGAAAVELLNGQIGNVLSRIANTVIRTRRAVGQRAARFSLAALHRQQNTRA